MDLSIFPVFITIAIIAVVALTEIVKRIGFWAKGFNVLLPVLFSGGLSLLMSYGRFFDRHQVFFWWAVIFSMSVVAYEAIIKRVLGLFEKKDE